MQVFVKKNVHKKIPSHQLIEILKAGLNNMILYSYKVRISGFCG
jgi:hypothetical protein